MATSTKALVTLSLSLAATVAACDEIAADEFSAAPDASVSLRSCVPPHCISDNSPYVGDYAWSNNKTKANTPAQVPFVDVDKTSHWSHGYLELDNTWLAIDRLVARDQGRLLAHLAGGATVFLDEAAQAFFLLTITDHSVTPPTSETIQVWIKDISSSHVSSGFTVWKYKIAAKASPTSVEFPPVEGPSKLPPKTIFGSWDGDYYSICPGLDEDDARAQVLPYVALNIDGDAAWLTDAYASGPFSDTNPSTWALTCERQAFAKPQEFLAVVPNGPDPRSYGVEGYNALANAYRAFYAGAPRTAFGTPVAFRDLAHDPPWFDQATSANLPPSPIWGHYEYVLESVYSDLDGASCYYTDSRFPSGAHRFYHPPGGHPDLPGWSSMTSCGATQSAWAERGSVAALVAKHILPIGGGSDS